MHLPWGFGFLAGCLRWGPPLAALAAARAAERRCGSPSTSTTRSGARATPSTPSAPSCSSSGELARQLDHVVMPGRLEPRRGPRRALPLPGAGRDRVRAAALVPDARRARAAWPRRCGARCAASGACSAAWTPSGCSGRTRWARRSRCWRRCGASACSSASARTCRATPAPSTPAGAPSTSWPTLLEASYRLLALAFPAIVVGPELARRYRRGRRVLPISVSLVRDAELPAADGAAGARTTTARSRRSASGGSRPRRTRCMLADVLERLGPAWRLVICGEGPLEADLRERLRELGVERAGRAARLRADRRRAGGALPRRPRAAARLLDRGRAPDPVRVVRRRAAGRGHGGRGRGRGGRRRRPAGAARATRAPPRRRSSASRPTPSCGGAWSRAGSSGSASTPSRPSAARVAEFMAEGPDDRGRAHRLGVRAAERGARARALRGHQPGRAVHPPDRGAGRRGGAAARRRPPPGGPPHPRRRLRQRASGWPTSRPGARTGSGWPASTWCPSASRAARARLPGADIRLGDASALPWEDASFDLVLQSMMFSSILDAGVRAAAARELARVLAPGGLLLSYDFFTGSPGNPNVRGLRRRELARAVPGLRAALAPRDPGAPSDPAAGAPCPAPRNRSTEPQSARYARPRRTPPTDLLENAAADEPPNRRRAAPGGERGNQVSRGESRLSVREARPSTRASPSANPVGRQERKVRSSCDSRELPFLLLWPWLWRCWPLPRPWAPAAHVQTARRRPRPWSQRSTRCAPATALPLAAGRRARWPAHRSASPRI